MTHLTFQRFANLILPNPLNFSFILLQYFTFAHFQYYFTSFTLQRNLRLTLDLYFLLFKNHFLLFMHLQYFMCCFMSFFTFFIFSKDFINSENLILRLIFLVLYFNYSYFNHYGSCYFRLLLF